MRILLIEDSRRLRETLAKTLSKLGHAVDTAASGEDGDELAAANAYDVAVLDLMLPGISGLDVLTQWRRRGVDVPILLLTALDGVEDRVRGLALGADDYLTKPFASEELVVRLEALVRRRYGRSNSQVHVGPLQIDFAARTVMRDGAAVVLTAREFALLDCLARRPGQILSRQQIEAHLYNEKDSPLSNAVDTAVYTLRRKLCPAGSAQLIHTRRGLGYVFELQPDEDNP